MLRPGGRGLLSTVCMIFRGRVGVEPGGSVRWGGVGTLLSFEGSGDWLLVASWYPRAAGWWCWGLGGLVVCELDSGREHLTRQTYLPLVWGGCGCGNRLVPLGGGVDRMSTE